jgi:tetratricopeptide (TPR) repeat protein/TolB-like protein
LLTDCSPTWFEETLVTAIARGAGAMLVMSLVAIGSQRAHAQQRVAAPPQRGGQPLPETPLILVSAFHAPTKEMAVEAADELRSRLQSEHSARELFVITKSTVEANLKSAGYPVDSALSVSDMMELGRTLHAEYIIDGTVIKSGPGNAVRFMTRVLIRTGTQTLAQPLPAANGKDVGEAAKMTERSISDAVKQMPSYRDCIAALRAGKYDEAIAKARMGVTAYANAAFSRVCLLNAYVSAKTAPPDSIIALGNQILSVDSTSMLALINMADAYDAKGDKDKATSVYERIHELDPNNQAVIRILIERWGQSAPAKAVALVNAVLAGDNPNDIELIAKKRLLELRLGKWRDAIATGEELIKLDTAAATIDFFQRQIGAAQSDSNTTKVLEIANKASQKFSKEASFPLLIAQAAYKAGQLQQALEAARRAGAADPKRLDAWKFVLVILTDLHQPDSALAAGQQAIAAGNPKDSIGDVLLARVAGPLIKDAQAGRTRAAWDAALKASQAVDAINSSSQSSFYVGVASFQAAADIMEEVQKLTKNPKPADKAQACALSKQAEEYLATTSISMPKGGRVDPGVAGRILGAVTSYTDFIGQVKKAFTCK